MSDRLERGHTAKGASEWEVGVVRNLPSSVLHVSRVHCEDMLAREKEREKEDMLSMLDYWFQRVVSAGEHKTVHQETLEILICYMCFESGSINEERLCVSSTDLHLESLNTFHQNQPGPFMRS